MNVPGVSPVLPGYCLAFPARLRLMLQCGCICASLQLPCIMELAADVRNSHHGNSSTSDFVLETLNLGLMCVGPLCSLSMVLSLDSMCSKQSVGPLSIWFHLLQRMTQYLSDMFPTKIKLLICPIIVLGVRLSQIYLANIVKALHTSPHIKQWQTQFYILILVVKR